MSTTYYAYKKPVSMILLKVVRLANHSYKKVNVFFENGSTCSIPFDSMEEAREFMLIFANYHEPIARRVSIGHGKVGIDILSPNVEFGISEYGEPIYIEDGELKYQKTEP